MHHLAVKILDAFRPSNLIILTSAESIPSVIPVSLLRTSTAAIAVGGLPADPVPLFSNARRVSMRDIQGRMEAVQHVEDSIEIALLPPPYMIQGIAASLMDLAEVYGIHATCFILSSWIGDGLELRDAERLAAKMNDCLKQQMIDPQDILEGWKSGLGGQGSGNSSIYL